MILFVCLCFSFLAFFKREVSFTKAVEIPDGRYCTYDLRPDAHWNSRISDEAICRNAIPMGLDRPTRVHHVSRRLSLKFTHKWSFVRDRIASEVESLNSPEVGEILDLRCGGDFPCDLVESNADVVVHSCGNSPISNQTTVYLCQEPWEKLSPNTDVVLASYRKDSEIPSFMAPVWNLYLKAGELQRLISPLSQWREPNPQDFVDFLLSAPNHKQKGKLESGAPIRPMLAVVGNCIGKRGSIVQELVRSGILDSVGACHHSVDYFPPKKLYSRYAEKAGLASRYHFLFALENHEIEGYFSEKPGHAFAVSTVPVVWNHATMWWRPGNHSYIALEDFSYNATLLAKHIKFLVDNPSEYEKYFAWKKNGGVRGAFMKAMANSLMEFPCNLCDSLHRHFFKTNIE